jgi:hypothetical protein
MSASVVKRTVLQVLFPVAMGWGLALTFAKQIDPLGALAFVPKDHPWRGAIETDLPLVIVIAVCAAVAVLAYRRWPRFLSVPDSTTWLRLLARLFLWAVATIPLLMIVSGVIGALLDSPPKEPNPQYYPLWVFTATFYPYAWTPAVALLLAGWSLRKRAP